MSANVIELRFMKSFFQHSEEVVSAAGFSQVYFLFALFFCDCRGRVLKKDCRGEWKTSSTCCCWWCTRSKKCAAWWVRKKAPILLRISFRFFFRSTVNKSYTSSPASIFHCFSSVGLFLRFFFIVFLCCCLRNALIVRKNRNIMLYGQRLLICLNIHYRFSFFFFASYYDDLWASFMMCIWSS